MEKSKQIITRAQRSIADAKQKVANSDATVAEAKQSMAEERKIISEENALAFPQDKNAFSVREKNGERKSEPAPKWPKNKDNKLDFPVVGIGASAGGLEALQVFFEHIKSPLGAAFVIVQHLSPDHESFMGELLCHYTSLPVSFIQDGITIEKNHIYLIPPKFNIFIQDGVLHHIPIIGHGLNLPIDIFFRSLAEDQQSNAVAIIMSGAGSDGTLGIRAIKEFGGIAMVQSPDDAKFDGMPRSAIATNMIDLTGPAGKLAHELATYLGHPLFTHPSQPSMLTDDNLVQYQQVLALLKKEKKVDFTSYRLETISRRLEKRISINRLSNLADYADYLRKTPSEIDTLFHEILIGVTRFFRDEDAFSTLEKKVFPEMFKNALNGELRIWVASCSTGEEAYSIAILLREYMQKNRINKEVKIFATDIDDKSLNYASTGFYPQNIVSDIPQQYLAKYFTPHGNGYLVNQEIRRMIIFASQNLIDNPPFFKLDLITCRNFLIYICLEAQQRVLSSFYVGLNPGGFLFLGSSESLDELAKGFDTVASKEKIFRKHEGYTPQYSPKSPMPLHLSLLEHHKLETNNSISQENSELLAILEQIDNAFLQPSLVIDANNNIIYAIRDGGKLLNISSGRVTTNLLKILPKDLSLIVSSMIRRAAGQENIISSEITLDKKPMILKCKHIVPANTTTSFFYISFEEITSHQSAIGRSRITPTDLSNRYQERIEELESEIQQHKESLRVAVEQLETSNEELQASNEELIASNEELQSSNEELQSVNEELYTVNIEHVRKLEEIMELSCDYDNLLSNTQIGTLFLDSDLVVRKISKIAGELVGIMQNDVGRPLSYFSLKKVYPRFMKDVEQVNKSKNMIEKELQLHRKIYCMRIVPYMTEESSYKGIIVSFVDLTDCKMRAIREATANQEKVKISTAQLEAAAAIAKMAYFQTSETTGKCVGSRLLKDLMPLKNGCFPRSEEWIHQNDITAVNTGFAELRGGNIKNLLLSFRSEYFGELRYYRLSASISENAAGNRFINGVIQNTTSVIKEQQRQEAQKKFWEDSINATPVLFFAKDADNGFRYVFANRFFLEFIGKHMNEIVGKTDEEITQSGKAFRNEDVQALNSETPVAFENEMVMPNGTVRYFHTTKQKSIGLDGHRLIIGIGSDITSQRLTMLDMQSANQCMSIILNAGNRQIALHKIMELLCERMCSSHCYWMSFNHADMTIKCEYEYAKPGYGGKIFDKNEVMSFDFKDEWYQCFLEHRLLDIPCISTTQEATKLLARYSNFHKKVVMKSVYATCLRNEDSIEGSVGFIYTNSRPQFSPERLSYLMTFAANLFESLLHRNFQEDNREEGKKSE